jgi:hypothetical protein
MKLRILALLVASLTVSTGASANLITNGDFSAGFTGFTSQYTPVAYPSFNALFPESTYTVGENPVLDHQYFVDLGENATNPMLLVNGSTSGGKTVLAYSSALLVAGAYTFSANAMNICCNSTFSGSNAQSELLFQISTNGTTWTTIATYFTNPPSDAGVLSTVSSYFSTNAPFSFRITDGSLASSGNDFAIDNLSLTAVPGPIVGAGLPGLVMALGALVASRRRRIRAA